MMPTNKVAATKFVKIKTERKPELFEPKEKVAAKTVVVKKMVKVKNEKIEKSYDNEISLDNNNDVSRRLDLEQSGLSNSPEKYQQITTEITPIKQEPI